jgi:hypothetical protein
MRPEELMELLRTRPFQPLRILMTDGRIYEVRHPDQVLVLRGRVDIGQGADPKTGVLERVDHCALPHIVRVEQLPAAVTPGNGSPEV